MQRFGVDIEAIREGSTSILVPSSSLSCPVPPREPAFFNSKARLNRDFTVLACSAFLSKFSGPATFIDALAGVGARSLRIANEVPQVERVIANDANPKALTLALESAGTNKLKNFEVSENEACRFLSSVAGRENRGAMVDIDPFGSPAKFIDCAIRATMHGGMLSVTATDQQVLNGLFQNTCRRKYGGSSARVTYSNELAIRLVLGCIRSIAGRLDIEIQPLFVESDQHYYRVYVRVRVHRDLERNLGLVYHCRCGSRGVADSCAQQCPHCGIKVTTAGPLWLGRLFERKFVERMRAEADIHEVDSRCHEMLERCIIEAEMPPLYYTLNEVASLMSRSPRKLQAVVHRLEECGFVASPTSLEPSGFRTSAGIGEIMDALD